MFKYQSLRDANSSIRLLCLQQSADHTTVLRGTLIDNVPMDLLNRDLVSGYTALSYVWGDPSRTGEILLDNQMFYVGMILRDDCQPKFRVGITESLQNTLRDMRDPTRKLFVWADALCIDQENIAERNARVSMMSRIYSAATHTVIYLGALTEAAAIAL